MATIPLKHNHHIDNRSIAAVSSRYKYLKIAPQLIGSTTVALDSSSTSTFSYLLPNISYNLAQSLQGYNCELAATGCQWSFCDSGFEPFSRVTFHAPGGQNLVDISYLNNNQKVNRKIFTSKEEFESNDIQTGMVPADTKATNYHSAYAIPSGNIFNAATGSAIVTAPTQYEPLYLQHNTTLETPLEISKAVPYGSIKNSLFELDRSIFWGDTMVLELTTAPSSKLGYKTTSVTDPTATANAFAVQPSLTQVYLYLAVEQNDLIKAGLMEKFAQGKMSFTTNHTTVYKTVTSGSGLKNVNLQLNAQQGGKLKRILHSLWPVNETLDSAYDTNNSNGVKCTSYQSSLNSTALQEQFVNCVPTSIANPSYVQDDYRYNKHLLKDSVISNAQAYALNWFTADCFAEYSRDPSQADGATIEGIDLILPITWQISMNLTGDMSHYTFVHALRTISIAPGAIMMV